MTRPEQEASKGTWAGTVDSPAGSDPFGLGEWLKEIPKAPLHPLMQQQAAAMAAATAIGLSVTSHIAGLMFGAMRGMTGTVQKTAAAKEETPVAEAAEPVASDVEAADVAAAAKTETPVKAPIKSKPEKSEPTKAEPVKAAPRADKPQRQKAAAHIVETQADDLKQISGIGPKLEQVLNGMGIRRYADVASWSEKDVQRFDAQLGFGGRITRDRWVEQAKALMKG